MDKEEEKEKEEKKIHPRGRRWPAAITVLALIGLLAGFIFLKNYFPKAKSSDGRTNVLILGTGGDAGQTMHLTDTQMFISLDAKNKKGVAIPIPRDLWIKPLATKINAVYFYQNEKDGQGLEAIKREIQTITGQPIHYAFLIDFEVFREIIDVLDGVSVNVERAFDDYRYPITGKETDDCNGDKTFACRYEHLHFDAGWQSMDGEKALKYVRSRHAEGEEGTDFARSRRQQILIGAIKAKILSPEVILSPSRMKGLLRLFSSRVEKNMSDRDLPGLIDLGMRMIKAEIVTCSFESFLYTPADNQPYQGQWVLLPKISDWREIKIEANQWIIGNSCQSN